MSFPPGTGMFRFPGLSPLRYPLTRRPGVYTRIHSLSTVVVAQFGNLRIKAYLRLPGAYRSLSRPSSASGTKAFTICTM